ncbi:class I SAM-dependent methyltransferase [soil metagenome]
MLIGNGGCSAVPVRSDMADPGHVSQTRVAYDATAEVYAQQVGTVLNSDFEAPLDRALLGAFVESLADIAPGPVADIGCGTGRVAGYLAGHGLQVSGIDVSTAMVDLARRAHPAIGFEEGQLALLPFGRATLNGAVCWYSIIHTPPDGLAVVCDELRRVLIDGGHLLVAFQAGGGEPVHRSDVAGTGVSLTNYRHDPDQVRDCLSVAGLHVEAHATREAQLAHETTPQAFVFARATS